MHPSKILSASSHFLLFLSTVPSRCHPDSYGSKTDPSNGSVSFEEMDALYTPNTDWCGQDVFTYTIHEGSGRCSGTSTVTVTVPCPPDEPTPPACEENKWRYDSSTSACVRAISTSSSLGMVLYDAPSDCCAAISSASGGDSPFQCTVIDGCITGTPNPTSTPSKMPETVNTTPTEAPVPTERRNDDGDDDMVTVDYPYHPASSYDDCSKGHYGKGRSGSKTSKSKTSKDEGSNHGSSRESSYSKTSKSKTSKSKTSKRCHDMSYSAHNIADSGSAILSNFDLPSRNPFKKSFSDMNSGLNWKAGDVSPQITLCLNPALNDDVVATSKDLPVLITPLENDDCIPEGKQLQFSTG